MPNTSAYPVADKAVTSPLGAKAASGPSSVSTFYQVCHKWLYDRRGKKGVPGRTLTEEDIAHYQRFVVALKHTIRLMEEMDQAIKAHCGWPIE